MKADDFLRTDDTQLREALFNGSHATFSPLEEEARLLDEAHRLTDMQAEFLLTLYYFEDVEVPVRLLKAMLSSGSQSQRAHGLSVLLREKKVPECLSDAVRRINESPISVVEEGMSKRALRLVNGLEDSAIWDHED